MELAIRLAGNLDEQRYPLSISGPASWHRTADGQAWQCQIELPDLPAQQIIAPSFACLDNNSGDIYQCQLTYTDSIGEVQTSILHPVPSTETDAGKKNSAATKTTTAVSTHIDCWHTEGAITSVRFEITVQQAECPSAYLLVVTSRPLQLAPSELSIAANEATGRTVWIPQTHSQMLADKSLRHRICSPTALAMMMSMRPQSPDLAATVQACYDPATKAYGAWPLAIRWAAQHGMLGAVETFHSWSDTVHLLETGFAIVCSIRFEQGKLTGAPLKRTSGHLVVLHGIEENHVLVKDPAGETIEQVDRRYLIDEFAQAWLCQRGAAYVFCRET